MQETRKKENLIFPQLSTINYELSPGGIAQLVERQLCKLEVRGSNPLASKASEKRGRQMLTIKGFTLGWTGINSVASISISDLANQ